MSAPTDVARARAAKQFQFTLPPGWGHLPAGEPVEVSVARLAPTGSGASTSELVALRAALRRQLRTLRSQTTAGGGVDVLLPVTTRAGAVVPANIVIAPASDAAVAAYLAGALPSPWDVAEEGNRSVSITTDALGDLPVTRALRIDRETPEDTAVDLIRIDYFVPVSQVLPRQLAVVISGTVLGRVGDERLPASTVEVLVNLVDAIVHTFRW
ncbi:hypothetical protein [Plantibacter sp. YIM 135249]|uniref:hypothetical protein n=1 Tax=Plantibacter sp. YIM 135249 TaxID=3423918 RepID=UPI003D342498